ncbi:hypothetical protein F3Y22_tig00110578pilonHSYRG00095 [Hibiscus syriacus]|uniref:Uncharacterized protein n=1 Tax=Hibiscus syriacus TaxID=106335 RepID=A0A6A3A6S2_HIBSY|nr:hypothetical protein F3Y22_tig00110578pilonHSYRG00095 [Hibiscus syriacus]
MGKSSLNGSSIKKSSSGDVPELTLIVKIRNNSQKPNISTQCADENAVAKLPLPSADDDASRGLVTQRPNALSTPMAANTGSSPWGFFFIWKSVVSSCNVSFRRTCLQAVWRASSSNCRFFGTGVWWLWSSEPNCSPPRCQTYFPHHDMPFRNPTVSGSTVEQISSFPRVQSNDNQLSTGDVNITTAQQSSCNMPSQMNQVVPLREFPASKVQQVVPLRGLKGMHYFLFFLPNPQLRHKSCPALENHILTYTALEVFNYLGFQVYASTNSGTMNREKPIGRIQLLLIPGVPSLPDSKTFKYWNPTTWIHEVKDSGTLMSLTLEDATLKEESFQSHLSWFPVVEKLVLSKCNALKYITISSYRFKTLILRECKQLKGADIDIQNLLSLDHKANHAPCFARLQKFIKKFDYSRGLKLVVRCDKNITIYENPKKIILPSVYDLKLDVVKSSVTLEDLLDDIL